MHQLLEDARKNVSKWVDWLNADASFKSWSIDTKDQIQRQLDAIYANLDAMIALDRYIDAGDVKGDLSKAQIDKIIAEGKKWGIPITREEAAMPSHRDNRV